MKYSTGPLLRNVRWIKDRYHKTQDEPDFSSTEINFVKQFSNITITKQLLSRSLEIKPSDQRQPGLSNSLKLNPLPALKIKSGGIMSEINFTKNSSDQKYYSGVKMPTLGTANNEKSTSIRKNRTRKTPLPNNFNSFSHTQTNQLRVQKDPYNPTSIF